MSYFFQLNFISFLYQCLPRIHIETNQLICMANQPTSFHISGTVARKKVYLTSMRTSHNKRVANCQQKTQRLRV